MRGRVLQGETLYLSGKGVGNPWGSSEEEK